MKIAWIICDIILGLLVLAGACYYYLLKNLF